MPRLVLAFFLSLAATAYAEGETNIGRSEFTAVHEGATYRFASAANRDAFVAAPARYAPQYGGYCAFRTASGYKAPIAIGREALPKWPAGRYSTAGG